jgi:hypothetical protein
VLCVLHQSCSNSCRHCCSAIVVAAAAKCCLNVHTFTVLSADAHQGSALNTVAAKMPKNSSRYSTSSAEACAYTPLYAVDTCSLSYSEATTWCPAYSVLTVRKC